MAKYRITVDTRNLTKKMNKVQQSVNSGSKNTVVTLANNLRNIAKELAPKYTGKTASLIKVFVAKTSKGWQAQVISQNSTPDRIYKKGVFNLPRWMHTSPNARGHINSGDPQYMYTAANQIRYDAKDILKQNLKLNR